MPSDALKSIRDVEQRLWIPGQGTVPVHMRAAQRAVEEYDDRLILARHEITGDWVAFIQLGPDRMFPVIGFGKELPHPDEIRATLERADTRRHGTKILDQIQRENARIQREKRAMAAEAIEEAAEYADFGFRKFAGVKTQIFIP
ncbi:MAG: hypothetical protein ACM3S1_05430 [Hyphomicrobiales bacterium]